VCLSSERKGDEVRLGEEESNNGDEKTPVKSQKEKGGSLLPLFAFCSVCVAVGGRRTLQLLLRRERDAPRTATKQEVERGDHSREHSDDSN